VLVVEAHDVFSESLVEIGHPGVPSWIWREIAHEADVVKL